jgi:hypothetical protein
MPKTSTRTRCWKRAKAFRTFKPASDCPLTFIASDSPEHFTIIGVLQIFFSWGRCGDFRLGCGDQSDRVES